MTTEVSKTIAATTQDFDQIVLESDIPVLVDFWAPWCSPCKHIAPILDRLADEFADRIAVVKVDADESPEVSSRFGVRGLPTVMLFDKGTKVHSLVGSQTIEVYRTAMNGVLSGDDSDEILDENLQNPEYRLQYFMTASVEEVRKVLARNPELATAPIQDNMTPLGIALRSGSNLDKKQLFASYSKTLDFHESVGLGRVAEVREMIDANPDQVNRLTDDGCNALIIAVINAQSECIDLLLDAGADVNFRTDTEVSLSPIEIAVQFGNVELVDQLLDRGATGEVQNAQSTPLLHKATMWQHTDVVKSLLARGFDAGAKDDKGKTAYEATKSQIEAALSNAQNPDQIKAIEDAFKNLESLRELLEPSTGETGS